MAVTRIIRVDSIGTASSPGELRTTQGSEVKSMAYADGFWSQGDGGGGFFFWDSTIESGDDDGGLTVYVSNGGWKRADLVGDTSKVLNVKHFGATGDNQAAKDTTGINAAIAFANANTSDLDGDFFNIYIPPGIYAIEEALTPISVNRVKVRGAGTHNTQIRFNPSLSGVTLFKFSTVGPGVLTQNGIRDMSIGCTGAFSKQKVAIELIEVSKFEMESIAISTWYDTGTTGSIGLRVEGHELCTFRNLSIMANRPLVLAKSDIYEQIHVDHFTFDGVGMGCEPTWTQYPLIEIEDGVVITNLAFKNLNLSGGTHCIYYNDTSSVASGTNMLIENVRTETEGVYPEGAYSLYIKCNYAIYNVEVKNCYFGAYKNGVYLRGVKHFSIRNSSIIASERTQLDAEAIANAELVIDNCYWYPNENTPALTGYTIATQAHHGIDSASIPCTARFIEETRLNYEFCRMGLPVVFPSRTATERDAIPYPEAGMTVYNTTTGRLDVYNGTSWVAL